MDKDKSYTESDEPGLPEALTDDGLTEAEFRERHGERIVYDFQGGGRVQIKRLQDSVALLQEDKEQLETKNNELRAELDRVRGELARVVDDMCESICADTTCYFNPINPDYGKPDPEERR